ncbi:MAG TPA: YbaB/EbfC family nucleoid-associated protein [Gemmatimonadales bacterium]|jgi:DNA-binding YbaB/EbfC family protein|nr:YbaB/EbfC family nucleoid-associated protein [Gemmatimonadales bacterium]
MADLPQVMQLGPQALGRLSQMQSDLAGLTVEATAGGGMVRVTADGRGVVRGVWIDPAVFAERDADFLSELVLAAVADAQRRAGELAQDTLRRMAPPALPFAP